MDEDLKPEILENPSEQEILGESTREDDPGEPGVSERAETDRIDTEDDVDEGPTSSDGDKGQPPEDPDSSQGPSLTAIQNVEINTGDVAILVGSSRSGWSNGRPTTSAPASSASIE